MTIAFVGDLHAERGIRTALATRPGSLLAGVRTAFERADLVIGNLETAVTDRGTAVPKTYTFRAPAAFLGALRRGGIDVVNLANNHGMDYGQVGLADTLDAAKSAGLPLIGAGRDAAGAYVPFVTTIRGQRIAILAATQFLNPPLRSSWTARAGRPGIATAFGQLPRLLTAVRSARTSGATVVVFLHWGESYVRCPTTDQRTLARQLREAGATVIVGSHSHLVSGAGYAGRSFVNYGLGNFMFYSGDRTDGAEQTGVQLVSLAAGRVTAAQWLPARIERDDLPRLLTGTDRTSALAEFGRLRGCTGLSARPG